MMFQKFFYKCVSISINDSSKIEDQLNEHGSQGWELVSVVESGLILRCFFKKSIVL